MTGFFKSFSLKLFRIKKYKFLIVFYLYEPFQGIWEFHHFPCHVRCHPESEYFPHDDSKWPNIWCSRKNSGFMGFYWHPPPWHEAFRSLLLIGHLHSKEVMIEFYIILYDSYQKAIYGYRAYVLLTCSNQCLLRFEPNRSRRFSWKDSVLLECFLQPNHDECNIFLRDISFQELFVWP